MWSRLRSGRIKAHGQIRTRRIHTRDIGRLTSLIRRKSDNPNTILKNFTGAAAVIMSYTNHHEHVASTGTLGYKDDQNGPHFNGSQFIAPLDEIINAIQKTGADYRELEKVLGLKVNSLGEEGARIIIVYNPSSHNLRETDSSAAGANDSFEEGGKTIGGISEALIDQTPEESCFFMPSDQEGLLHSCNYRSAPLEAFISNDSLKKWLHSQQLRTVEEK